MTLLSNDPLTQLSFSVYENKGIFAVLLGSGISRAADIPTGWEITLDLIRRVAMAQGVDDQTDWARWYRKTFNKEPDYSELLEELGSSPAERRSVLHSYIEPTPAEKEEEKKVPTLAHRAIASLVHAAYIRVIVTTNFDRLMENALREVGVEPTVVASPDALSGAEPISHTSCYLLKLHGDYKDARILNTDDELSGYSPQYDALLDRIFDEYGIIVVGWSGEWDNALRAAFLRAPNRRYPVYWCARNVVSDNAQELINHRRARLIKIADANSFFAGVLQRVQTLEQTHRQSPLSMDLLVNSTKRYLGRSECRIQLDELFGEEAERLIAAGTAPEFKPQGTWSNDEFRSRVARYEAATEPLARMAGVLGRWGDESEVPLMLDIMRSIFSQLSVSTSGLVPWLHLRTYPVVILFTAHGLGLTRAGRWKTLHAFLVSELCMENGEPLRVVDELFLWSWEGANKNMWDKLEGLEERKTPLSDHLFNLFSEWGNSFIGVSPNFELLFERFEVLASLAFIERESEDTLKEAVKNGQAEWIPVGRTGWHRSAWEHLRKEVGASELTRHLLDAGFAKGSESFLELSLDNFSLVARRM